MDPFALLFTGLITFWQESWLIAVLKFIVLVYTIVIIIDVILILMLTDIKSSVRENLTGGHRPTAPRSRYIKRWETILSRLESENPSQYKVAILEADVFAEEILEILGYHGSNMKDRLDHMKDYDVESKDELITGHAVRNRIINEPHFEPTREEAEATLRHFSNFFKEADIF